MKLFITRQIYLISGIHVLWNYILNVFMGMLGCQMMVEVFLFLSVFNQWKSGEFIVVNSPWRWLILSRVGNPGVCVCVCACACVRACVCARALASCAAACDCVHIHRHMDSNSHYVHVYITFDLIAYVTMNYGWNLLCTGI
jgi:hypothetical protein